MLKKFIPSAPIYVVETTFVVSDQTMTFGVSFSIVPSILNDFESKINSKALNFVQQKMNARMTVICLNHLKSVKRTIGHSYLCFGFSKLNFTYLQ